MLPTSKERSSFKPVGPLKLHILNSIVVLNVNAILPQGQFTRYTLDAVPTGWASKMLVTFASCTNAVNNGEFQIEKIDLNNNYIYIKNPVSVAQAGAAGTATLSGYVNLDVTENGTAVKNGKNEIIGWQYSNATGYYIFGLSEYRDTIFQLINTHATAGSLTATAKWSLNGINWISFSPNKIITIMAGESDIIVFDNQSQFAMIRIELDNPEITPATFYAIVN